TAHLGKLTWVAVAAALGVEVFHRELNRLQRACGDRGLVAGKRTLRSDLNLVRLAGSAATAARATATTARSDAERRQREHRKEPETSHPCLQWIAGSCLRAGPDFIRPPLSSRASISANTSLGEL